MIDNTKKLVLSGIAGFGVLMLILFAFSSYFTVEPGEVAVRTRMGKIVDTYTEGIHLKIPMIESVYKFTTRIVRDDITTEAFSQDLQPMEVHIAVNHRIESKNITSIYRNLGTNYIQTIVNPAVQEILKSITARYAADQIIAKRSEVVKIINDDVKSKMKENDIIVTDVQIINLEFSKGFINAVEAKQIAEQQSLQAKKLVEKAKMEAEQKIATARAEAESLKMQKEQVTTMTLELRRVEVQKILAEKWNGQLPQQMLGNAMPFINVGK